jgi:hypothetical protein
MPVSLDRMIASLPAARRAKIDARAAELFVEEMSLVELRKACVKTQSLLAKKLKIGQDGISKIEKRSDLLISTLRHYIEGLGGDLQLVVRFDGRPPVALSGLADLRPTRKATRKRASPSRPAATETFWRQSKE